MIGKKVSVVYEKVINYKDIFLISASLFIVILIIFTGCSSSKALKAPPTPQVENTIITEYVQGNIERGLSLFEGGHYAEAAGSFEATATMPGIREQESRHCLMAAAVSRLIINDREGFAGNLNKIKDRYDSVDFILMMDGDTRLKMLMELKDKIQEGKER